MNDNSLWYKVEKEIADFLLEKLEHEQLTPERAIEIAKFVIQSIPHKLSEEQMLEIIPKLDDKFTELSSIVYRHMLEEDEMIRKKGLENMRTELNQYFAKKL